LAALDVLGARVATSPRGSAGRWTHRELALNARPSSSHSMTGVCTPRSRTNSRASSG